MKRILSRIILLVMLTSFFACTGELENAGGNIGDKAKVQLNFTGVNGFAVTRTVNQTAVSNATVYLFNGKEAESSLIYTLPVVLAEPSETSGPSGTFETPEGGTFHIEVITNADQLTGIETYSDFLSKTTTAAISGNLVMQGSAASDVTLTAGTIADINIELVRLAATFTVTGAEEAGLTDVSFTLKDAVKASYFVKHVSDDSFTIPADAEKGNSEVPYSYENPENTTSIVINGQMNGAAYTTEIAIEKVVRNHLYTVKLVNNNGTIEPKLTVTDWADISAGLIIGAGKELKMTASIDDAGVVTPVSTVVYPEEKELKSTATIVVPVSESNTVYKIWVGSANIEAALTNTALPDGWMLTPPADTRADYLWEKGHWTLTIPANTATEAKSVTITATNKLVASAKVEMKFEQEGKVEEGTNPGDMENWGGDVAPSYTTGPLKKVSTTNGWTLNTDIYDNGGFATKVTYTNGIQGSGLLSSKGTTAYFFQWGRYLGFPSNVARTIFNSGGSATGNSPNSSQFLPGISPYDTQLGYIWNSGLAVAYGACYMGGSSWTKQRVINCSIMFGMVSSFNSTLDYCGTNTNCTWEERGGNPCPKGYRVPTADELAVLIPTGKTVNGSCAEIKTIKGVKYAMQWKVVTNNTLPYVEIKSARTTLTSVSVDNAIFNDASSIRLYPYGYIDNAGEYQQRGKTGVYWTSESAVNTISNTTGYGGKYLQLDFSGSKVDMYMEVAPRCFGGCVLPIKDAKITDQTSVTPWLPLSGI